MSFRTLACLVVVPALGACAHKSEEYAGCDASGDALMNSKCMDEKRGEEKGAEKKYYASLPTLARSAAGPADVSAGCPRPRGDGCLPRRGAAG